LIPRPDLEVVPLAAPTRALPIYLHIEEAATLARTSVKTVRHWLLVGKLKGRRPGRRVLIRTQDLIALIEGAQ
jgi:excisionase family DNA binding protein